MNSSGSVQANASGIFIRVNQVGYSPSAGKIAIVLSSTSLSGVRYDVFNSNNTSVLNGTISTASKGSWGDAGGANCAYSYAVDFSSLNTAGSGYYIKINAYTSPAFDISNSVYSSLSDLSMQFFKVQRCGNTNPQDHGVCHTPGTNSSIDGKPDGASGTKDFTGGWHDASDYIKFMSTIGHVTDVMLTTYIHHPEAFPAPASSGGALTEAKAGLDFIHKMWDNTNQILYMEVADGLDHDVENDDLDSRSKTWPQDDNTIYGAARPVHPCPAGTGANLAGKAAAALALGAKIWGDPSGPSYNAALAGSYLTAAQQIYTWGKTRTGIAGDADEFYVDTDYKDDMAWAAAELYRATGTAAYLTEAKSYCDSAGEWYNKSNTSLNWSRAYHWANYEVASLDPTYKNTATSRMNNHLNLKKNYANGQFWNTSSEPKWGTYEAMSNNAIEALMYQELTGITTYAVLAQQQIDYLLGRNPWGVSMLNGAGTTWFKNPRHRVTTLNRVNNPNYQLRGAWSEGFETSAQYAVDQQDPLLAGQEDPNIVQFNDNRMIWHDNRRDYATNEVTISGNAAGMAMVAFMGGGASPAIPAVPMALSAAAASPAQINVTWDAVSGATGYDLEVDGTTVSNVTSPYAHSGLTAGSTHNYKVRAKNSAGTSAWSSIVSATTSLNASTDYITNGDAYVRDGTYAATNYGTAATIDVKGDPDEGYNRKGFVRFDLTGRSGSSVASALLKVYCNAASASTPVKIYGLTGSDEWIESGTGSITWNNQPGSTGAVLVGTINVPSAGWYTIDATGYVNSQIRGDKKMTFKMQIENNNGASISFNSKENTSNKPILTVS
ncbi:glycoside hydrolase family 9 protein [Paenibacillus monticola]|uniref:Endoglucanase n=1 Tax=Paenibacillus monticola TaxID=2666075 RepID=A0A7X2H599_9BACL|nr:glycoside hydrolase family 9 protein [Paenibacillus monticola]MRN53779.1 DNRLRE domain-containing protein [Paenibacillus monticola]